MEERQTEAQMNQNAGRVVQHHTNTYVARLAQPKGLLSLHHLKELVRVETPVAVLVEDMPQQVCSGERAYTKSYTHANRKRERRKTY